MNDKRIGNCTHSFDIEEGVLILSNDDDCFYKTEFNSIEEVECFISKMRHKAEEAFKAGGQSG